MQGGGRGEDAFDEALKSLEIGQKIQDSQAPLLHYLVAIALKSIGLDAIELIADLTPISPENAIRLEEFKENKERLVTTFKGEYKGRTEQLDLLIIDDRALHELFVYSDILRFLPLPAKNKFYLKPNKTKAIFADYTRSLINASKKSCDSEDILEIDMLTLEQTLAGNYMGIREIKLFFIENLTGKIFHDMTIFGYSSIFERSCDIDLRILSLQETLKSGI